MTGQKVLSDITSRTLDAGEYPLLSKIKDPSDLRDIPIEQLEELCAEIRKFLIEQLSSNPGHFASSMGAVELTVALHYVFNTPYDRIVWDVGHQAYSHKLLTGRSGKFHTNRKLGGISGFPSPTESEYDSFTAGHASNSISAALGMSVASALKKESPDRNIVAVIGDASISGGLAFEGLNNAANTNSNLLIILNDNDMSIDRNVGSLNGYLAHLTTTKAYNNARYNVYKLLRKAHVVNEKSKGRILRFNNSLKSLITREQNIFEGLNIRYFGPFDGHDLPRIIRILQDIKDLKGPRILHLRTIKGKGFQAAEDDPAVWHAPGKFNPDNGERVRSHSKDSDHPKFQDVMGKTLVSLASKNDKIVAITAAMPSGTSINLMQEVFPKRTFDVGISEGHAVTFAAGLAKDGMLPYVAIYSSFLQRAYDNIIHDIAILNLPVTLCIDRAGLVGEDGVTHHGAFDLAYLRAVPNMQIAAPADGETLRSLLYASQLPDREGPWAIRYPRGTCYDNGKMIENLKVGTGKQLSDGTDVTLLTIGAVLDDSIQAVKELEKENISIAHYDMIWLKPLDEQILRQCAESGRPIVTVEDGSLEGGFGSEVLEWLNDNGYSIPTIRLGLPDSFVSHGSVSQLKGLCGIDRQSIVEAIRRAAKGGRTRTVKSTKEEQK